MFIRVRCLEGQHRHADRVDQRFAFDLRDEHPLDTTTHQRRVAVEQNRDTQHLWRVRRTKLGGLLGFLDHFLEQLVEQIAVLEDVVGQIRGRFFDREPATIQLTGQMHVEQLDRHRPGQVQLATVVLSVQ